MKRILLLSLSAGMAALIFSSYATGPFAGGAGNHTGSAGSVADCSTGSGCHSTNNSALGLTVQLIDNGGNIVSDYVGGTTYRVLLGGNIATSAGTFPRFGFQISVVKSSDNTTQAGTMSTGGRANIAVRNSGSLQLVEHTTPLAALNAFGYYFDSVSFVWTAPTAGTGKVKFFAGMNAVNFNGLSTGDAPNSANFEFNEGTVGIASVEKMQLSVYPNPATSSLHLKLPSSAASCNIRVWNMSGRLLANEAAIVSGGEAATNISGLKPGNYYILASQGDKQYGTSFTKQ